MTDDAKTSGWDFSTALIQACPAFFVTIDKSGRTVLMNDAMLGALGYAFAEVVGTDYVSTFVPEEDRPQLAATFDDLMVRNVPTVSVNHLLAKDGRKLLVEWHGRHIPGADGKPEALFGVGIEISRRHLMEEALQRERDEAQKYLDLAGVMFLALDADGRVTLVNRKGCEILKTGESDIIGRMWSDTFVPEEEREHVKRVFRGLVAGQVQLYEHAQGKVLTATGEKRVVEWHNALIRDTDGSIKGTLSSGVDVTERRRAEELHQVMQQIATAVHTCRSTSELFGTIQNELGRVINTENFFIALYDKASDTISLNYFVDQEDQEDFKSFPAGKTLSGYVIKHNMPLLLNREQMDRWVEAGLVDMVGTPSLVWLGVPLRVAGEVTGVVVVQSYTDEDEFGLTDLEMLGFVSSQIGLAIERKKNEEQLRESESRNRAILDAVPDIMFQFTKDGAFVSCDAPPGARLALPPEEFIGKHLTDVFPPAFAESTLGHTRRAIESGQMQIFEYQIPVPMPDGEMRDFEARIVPAGENALGVVRDITEHKRADRLLEALNGAALAMEQTQTPEDVFAAVSAKLAGVGLTSFVLLAEDDGEHVRVAYVGDCGGLTGAAERVMGQKLAGMRLRVDMCEAYRVPIHSRETVFTEDVSALFEAVEPMLGAGTGQEVGRIPGIGKCIHAPLASEDRVFGILSVHSNLVTQRDVPAIRAFANQVAAALRRATLVQELRNRLEELRLTHDELLQAQKMEAVGRLAGGVAHDFNNLLTAIAGYAELILGRTDLDQQIRADIGEIRKASDQASGLTRQLLAFSRRQPLEPQAIDLNATVASLRSMLGRLVGEDVAIETALAPNGGCACADAGQIEQVITNMVVNARDAMPDGGKIVIRTDRVVVGEAEAKTVLGARPGTFVRLSIEDTGSGIPAEVLAHIFEPFFTTKGKGKGTGLGLSVVYGIVSQHEGWIAVETAAERGTAFRIFIPASEEPAAAETVKSAPLDLTRGRGERILLVEDEEAVREFATRALRESGYTVYEANGADQAMEVFDNEGGDFDVVFSDVVLPDRSGIGLASDLLTKKPGLHILLASGYTDQKSQWPAIREKGFRFLQKPYSLPDLLGTIRDIMNPQ
jgi:PAS domain S-box-containing protein